LLQQGDIKGAINALQAAVGNDKNDAVAWYYLGLALKQNGDQEEAVESFDKASATKMLSFNIEYESAGEEIRGAQLLRLKLLLSEAIDIRKQSLNLITNTEKARWAREFLTGLELRATCLERAIKTDAGQTVLKKRDLPETKLQILKRHDAKYTDEARELGVSGSVTLLVAFTADGRVEVVKIMKSLPYGMTEQAIKAISQTKFRPATVCGQPIITFKVIESKFNTYPR